MGPSWGHASCCFPCCYCCLLFFSVRILGGPSGEFVVKGAFCVVWPRVRLVEVVERALLRRPRIVRS
nr:hypothetical protein [Candidatus Similichlamydia laticola]